jgi:hypothetical protein
LAGRGEDIDGDELDPDVIGLTTPNK